MNINDKISIHTFDDGNLRFINFPNEWTVTDIRYNGGKLELVNTIYNEVKIYSISTWKVRLNIEQYDKKAITTNATTTNATTTNTTTTYDTYDTYDTSDTSTISNN